MLELNSYGNVDCRNGIPAGYVKVYANAKTLDKLKIKYYTALIEFEEYRKRRFRAITTKIITKYSEKKLKKYLEEKRKQEEEKKERVIKKAYSDFSLVLLALYTINKEAKRQRNIKYNIADDIYQHGRKDKLAHYQVGRAKQEQEYLYLLKERAIEFLLQNKRFDKIEAHEVFGEKMACLYADSFSFHFNYEVLKKFDIEAETTGEITSWISSEKKRKGMGIKRALNIIENLKTN